MEQVSDQRLKDFNERTALATSAEVVSMARELIHNRAIADLRLPTIADVFHCAGAAQGMTHCLMQCDECKEAIEATQCLKTPFVAASPAKAIYAEAQDAIAALNTDPAVTEIMKGRGIDALLDPLCECGHPQSDHYNLVGACRRCPSGVRCKCQGFALKVG